jgi:proline dehydrogenase
MRAPVLALTRARWFRRIATGGLGWRVASRFVAGDNLDAAIATARALQTRGCATILDHLGENVTTREHAAEASAAYVRALDRIESEPGLDVTISVKLTQLGLDFSRDLAAANLERVVDAAGDRVVMIDMESSAYVDRTLTVFGALRQRTDRVGVCLQACLHRTTREARRTPRSSAWSRARPRAPRSRSRTGVRSSARSRG